VTTCGKHTGLYCAVRATPVEGKEAAGMYMCCRLMYTGDGCSCCIASSGSLSRTFCVIGLASLAAGAAGPLRWLVTYP
jgi:hypothetical protein